MNLVFRATTILAYVLIFVFIVLPSILGWVGIDMLSVLFQPLITMAIIIIAGLLLLGRHMLTSPVLGIFLFILLVIVAVLASMGIHYQTVNPFETMQLIVPGFYL